VCTIRFGAHINRIETRLEPPTNPLRTGFFLENDQPKRAADAAGSRTRWSNG